MSILSVITVSVKRFLTDCKHFLYMSVSFGKTSTIFLLSWLFALGAEAFAECENRTLKSNFVRLLAVIGVQPCVISRDDGIARWSSSFSTDAFHPIGDEFACDHADKGRDRPRTSNKHGKIDQRVSHRIHRRSNQRGKAHHDGDRVPAGIPSAGSGCGMGQTLICTGTIVPMRAVRLPKSHFCTRRGSGCAMSRIAYPRRLLRRLAELTIARFKQPRNTTFRQERFVEVEVFDDLAFSSRIANGASSTGCAYSAWHSISCRKTLVLG